MKVNIVHKLIEDIPIGSAFKHEDEIWIKTNASHKEAGFECVELQRGHLSYIEKGTKVMQVEAEIRIFT